MPSYSLKLSIAALVMGGLWSSCAIGGEPRVEACLRAETYPDGGEAWRLCDEAIRLDGLDPKTSAKINLQIGEAIYYAHRPGLALPYLDQALESDPSLDQAWRLRGWVHFMSQDWQKSLSDFTNGLELKPNDPDMLLAIAYFHYATSGNCEQAIREYEAILADHPNHYLARRNLADIYECQDSNPERQIAEFDKIIAVGRDQIAGYRYFSRSGPEDFDFYAMMRGLRADAYLSAERAAEAANDVDWLFKNYPGHFKIFIKRSRLRLLQNDFAGALADAESTLDQFPWDVKAIEAKVESLRRLRRHDELITYVSGLLASGTGFSNQDFLLFWRSYSYKKLGKKDEAIADLNQAMALNPGYVWSVSTQLEQSGYIFGRIPRYGIDPTPDILSKPFVNALEACMVDPECMI